MINGNRFFKRMWDEEYYIFDSEIISEKEFDERREYEDYRAFKNSLTGDEVVDLVNCLTKENKQLRFDFKEMKDLLHTLEDENKELRILVDSLKQQNKKFKARLNDLGVEYYD